MGKIIKDTIHANGIDIGIYTQDFENEFLSLTDIARYKSDEPTAVIQNWMRNRDVIEFLGLWERLHNPNFNPLEFEGFRKQAGANAFTMSPKKWIEATNAIGIVSKAGRYGGTYAHSDIAKKPDAMAGHMLIVILRCLLRHGFLQSSSYIL